MARLIGNRVDGDRLSYEMAVRCLTGAELARLSRVRPETISRMLRGRRALASTRSRIAAALVRCPIQPGAELLVGDPPERTPKPLEGTG